jgi:hypothetical protein
VPPRQHQSSQRAQSSSTSRNLVTSALLRTTDSTWTLRHVGHSTRTGLIVASIILPRGDRRAFRNRGQALDLAEYSDVLSAHQHRSASGIPNRHRLAGTAIRHALGRRPDQPPAAFCLKIVSQQIECPCHRADWCLLLEQNLRGRGRRIGKRNECSLRCAAKNPRVGASRVPSLDRPPR